MSKLQVGLHAATGGLCLLLLAGFWQLRAGRVPSAAPVVAPPVPQAWEGEEVRRLRSEVDSLRLRIQELEARPPVAAPAAGAPALTREQLLAGLDDPKVQEKLKGMSPAPGFTFRAAGGGAAAPFLDGMELAPQQKEALGKVLSEHQARVDALLRRRMTEREVPPEEIQSELEKAWSDVDARVQSLLSYAQFEDYRKRVAPPRKLLSGLVKGAPKGGGIYIQQMVIDAEEAGEPGAP